MTAALSSFAARLRENIVAGFQNQDFDALAVELFYLQFQSCPAYQQICRAQRVDPAAISVLRQTTPSSARWKHIPFVPAAAFKSLRLTSIPILQSNVFFQSSGTTAQTPGRHFHNAESLAVYEASLWRWFRPHVLGDLKSGAPEFRPFFLAPPPSQAPHSSLIHMFETVRQMVAAPTSAFLGTTDAAGLWNLDFRAVIDALQTSMAAGETPLLLGTAFSFVHLLDFLAEKNLRLRLPENSRVMETGGYKNRSRVLPKAELHRLITERLGVLPENIICEYGMSELSSQAYDGASSPAIRAAAGDTTRRQPGWARSDQRVFHFPPWARVQIISPETGREVAEGETGLIRVLDLANVFSVAAIQTEDLGIRRGAGFEFNGRAPAAEPRGCSLNNPEAGN